MSAPLRMRFLPNMFAVKMEDTTTSLGKPMKSHPDTSFCVFVSAPLFIPSSASQGESHHHPPLFPSWESGDFAHYLGKKWEKNKHVAHFFNTCWARVYVEGIQGVKYQLHTSLPLSFDGKDFASSSQQLCILLELVLTEEIPEGSLSFCYIHQWMSTLSQYSFSFKYPCKSNMKWWAETNRRRWSAYIERGKLQSKNKMKTPV